MSRTARLLLFGVGAAGLGAVLVYGLGGHPRVRPLSGRLRPRARRHRGRLSDTPPTSSPR